MTLPPQFVAETDVRATYRALVNDGFVAPAKTARKRRRENDENLDPGQLPAPARAPALTQVPPSQHDHSLHLWLQPKRQRQHAARHTGPGTTFAAATPQTPPFIKGPPGALDGSTMLDAWVQGIGTLHHLAARAQRICVDVPGDVAADLLAAKFMQRGAQPTAGILSELFHIACADPISPPGGWCAEVLTHMLQEPCSPMASWLTQACAVTHILQALQGLKPSVAADNTRAHVLLVLLGRAVSHAEPLDCRELDIVSVITHLCQRFTGEACEAALQTLWLQVEASPSARLTASFQHHVGLYLHKTVAENSPWAARLLRALSQQDATIDFPQSATENYPLSETQRRAMVCGLLRSYNAAPALLQAANNSRLNFAHIECLLRIALDAEMEPNDGVALCQELNLPTALYYLRLLVSRDQRNVEQREWAKHRKATATLRAMR